MIPAPASRQRMFLTVFTLIVSLTVLFSSALPAYAAVFNPGCAGTIGDSAALEAAVVITRTNSQADIINLVAGCTYTLSTSLHFLSDGGNAVMVNGNGAIVDGNGVNFVFNNDAGTQTTINSLTISFGRTGVLNTGTLTLNSVTITSNTSTNVGGGIINGIDGVFTGFITVNNSTVTNNSATNSGGGIYNAVSSTVILNSTTVRDNDTTNGGGIYNRGTVTATNSTITGNEATTAGGGIYSSNSTVTLNNSTVSSNIANVSVNLGSNLYSIGASSSYFVSNSIVANPVGASNCAITAGTLTANNSLFEDGSCSPTSGSGNISLDPNLGTLTGSPAYFPLNPGSPAINAGNNALVSGVVLTDQAGNARIRGGIVDMGSYEAEIPIITISPSTANASEGGSAGLTVSRVGSTSAAQPVSFTVGGSVSGSDFNLDVGGIGVTTSLTIPAGQASAVLDVNAINDAHTEADETVVITLSDTNHYDVGAPSASTVTIPANDFVVINGNDSGEGSLRQAVINANAFNTNDTISFSGVALVTLSSGELGLANNGTLTINGGGVIVNANGASRVFNVGGGANVTLNRLTVTGGNGVLGGGINNDGTLVIIDSTIGGNSASGGGGINNSGTGTLTLTNSTIAGNTTSLAGGAILNNGVLNLNNSTITGNSTGFGNAIVANGTVTINNSIIADPTAGNNCGGVGTIDVNFSVIEGGGCGITNNVDGNKTGDPALGAMTGSPAYFPITDTSIAFNAGSNALVPGGATTDQPGNPRIRGSIVDIGAFEVQCLPLPYTVPASNAVLLYFAVECANSASSNDVIHLTNSTYTLLGAALGVANNGTLIINGNGAVVSGSNASRVFDVASGANLTLNALTVRDGSGTLGGGINNNGTLTINRSTVRNGAASLNGGGIQNNTGANLTLINSTVSGNNSVFNGGGIFNNGSMTITNSTIAGNNAGNNGSGINNNLGTAVLNNSIIADNTGAGNCTHTNLPTVSNSVIEGGGCGVTNGVNGNKTGDPGLGTLTGSPAFYPLLAGSIAIDAGSNALIPGGVTTDQAGNTRIQNATVDMGAFEATPASLTVTLTMQGRPGGASATKVVTLHVQIRLPGGTTPISSQDIVSNTSGQITIPRLTPGSYDIWVKGTHTLAVVQNVTLAAGSNSATTALLREGDASDDNVVQLPDFSLLAAAFGTSTGNPGYNAQADFNNDGQVQLVDFSLLASNFTQAGAP